MALLARHGYSPSSAAPSRELTAFVCLPRQAEFKAATEAVKTFSPSKTVPDEAKLAVYSLFKQATVGDVNTERPGMFDFQGKAKWDAWKAREGMSPARQCRAAALTPRRRHVQAGGHEGLRRGVQPPQGRVRLNYVRYLAVARVAPAYACTAAVKPRCGGARGCACASTARRLRPAPRRPARPAHVATRAAS